MSLYEMLKCSLWNEELLWNNQFIIKNYHQSSHSTCMSTVFFSAIEIICSWSMLKCYYFINFHFLEILNTLLFSGQFLFISFNRYAPSVPLSHGYQFVKIDLLGKESNRSTALLNQCHRQNNQTSQCWKTLYKPYNIICWFTIWRIVNWEESSSRTSFVWNNSITERWACNVLLKSCNVMLKSQCNVEIIHVKNIFFSKKERLSTFL